MTEKIDHPAHYNVHPSGIEAIELCEHFGFNIGNAVKYLFRAGRKEGNSHETDLRKARWYLARGAQMPWGFLSVGSKAHMTRLYKLVTKVHDADPKSVLGQVLSAWKTGFDVVQVETKRIDESAMGYDDYWIIHRQIMKSLLDAFDHATEWQLLP